MEMVSRGRKGCWEMGHYNYWEEEPPEFKDDFGNEIQEGDYYLELSDGDKLFEKCTVEDCVDAFRMAEWNCELKTAKRKVEADSGEFIKKGERYADVEGAILSLEEFREYTQEEVAKRLSYDEESYREW